MKQEEAKKIYEKFQNMTTEEYLNLIENSDSREEKEFYGQIRDFLIQEKQEKIINQPFTIWKTCKMLFKTF